MSSKLLTINGHALQLFQPASVHQEVAVGAVSTQSAAISAGCTFIELYCDSTCFVTLGASPSATLLSIPVYSGIPRTLKVTPGHKVAVIGAVVATLLVTELL